jgi:enamine deaminase RidA (YjgF/YER057c/UK114 family)
MKFALLFAAAAVLPAQIRHLQPDGLSRPTGYTHVVAAKGRETVYIAGQVAQNAQGEIVGKGDLKAQTTQVFENLKIALAAAGCTFADVVKITVFVANYKPAEVGVIREVRSRYITGNPPASTLVGVQSLANADYLIEIEAIAVRK